MTDTLQTKSLESNILDTRLDYADRINKPIESNVKIVKKPDGSFVEVSYKVANVVATGPYDWKTAYDINSEGTHTTGRRDNFESFLEKGIEPFGTPVNEGLAEVPAVVCGYLKNVDTVQDSETFLRNYGDIFNPESTGFVVVLGPEIKNTPEYEVAGPEARIKDKITTTQTKAIIVGNDKMERFATECLKKTGQVLPVIRLQKNETTI